MGKGAGLPHMNSGGGTSQPIQLLIEIFFKHVAGKKKKYLFDLLYVAKRNIPFNNQLIKPTMGSSLVFQWLRLHPPNAGGPGWIPGQVTRSHMLQLRVYMLN